MSYDLPHNPSNSIYLDYTMSDNQNRPLTTFRSYKHDDSTQVSGWLNIRRTDFYYDGSYAKGNVYQEYKSSNIIWHKVSEHTLVFEGLPEGSAHASVELFNLAGVTLQKYNTIVTAGRSIQIRLNDFLPEGYYTFRIRQGNQSKYILLNLH